MTADNASSNDTMTDELAGLIVHFGGDLTRTRCLLHVINLVAKTVMKEFDVQDDGEGADDLTTLAEGIDAGDLKSGRDAETRSMMLMDGLMRYCS